MLINVCRPHKLIVIACVAWHLLHIGNMLPVLGSLLPSLWALLAACKMCFIASIAVAVVGVVVAAFALQIANVVGGSEFVFNSP